MISQTTDNDDDEKIESFQQQQQNQKNQKAQSTKKHEKDSKEVLEYLSNWKYRSLTSTHWKFNKNTQSWLLRHMYNAEKVPKSMFSLLEEYLKGIQSDQIIERIKEDAAKRALQYKEWEKEQQPDNDNEETEKNEEHHNRRKEYKRARKVLSIFSTSKDTSE
eukprot:CAMPEP_0178978618 /NCGR_PEP_ID=MMETSP0789-20121207/25301_1 /TAXON_ID=3005 /ORGANISM="Rhizosolenia setigera, Strain CCMP 1694" /LENGTH=161 /DNA_ID=CAMNT_0020668461 /DNA_START=100 /DNA_END=585 /DNA_ORIENTATION=+